MEIVRPSIGIVLNSNVRNDSTRGIKVFQRLVERQLNYYDTLVLDTSKAALRNKDDVVSELANRSKRDQLLMIVGTGSARDNVGFYNPQVITEVRERIGFNVPAYILDSELNSDVISNIGNNTFATSPYSPELLKKAEEYRFRKEASRENQALLEAHHRTFPEVDLDDNTRLVCAYLRWGRLSPSHVIAQEFDAVKSVKLELPASGDNAYSFDLKALKELPSERRALLSGKFEKMVNGPRKSLDCRGFAIDMDTLSYEITFGFGGHYQAYLNLIEQLARTTFINGTYQKVDEERIVFGLIGDASGDFQTPVVQLPLGEYLAQPMSARTPIKRVVNYLLQQRLLIPVDKGLKVIDEDHELFTES